MTVRASRAAALAAATVLGVWQPLALLATATATSQVSFTNLLISPAAGTLVFLTNWTVSAFAQAGPNNQFNSGSTAVFANASGDFSLGHGESAASTPFGLNVSGLGSTSASVPGQIVASDNSSGRGTVSSLFEITGGSGSVNASFSLLGSGMLSVFTDAYGQSAQAETVLTLELNGNPLLFADHFFSIGPNDSQSLTFSDPLNNSTSLQYNTPYSIVLEADAETMVNNVPEPGTWALALMGVILVWFVRHGHALRKRSAKRKLGGQSAAVLLPRSRLHAPRPAPCLPVVMLLGLATVCQATYIGSDPPNTCQTCGAAQNRVPGGNTFMSLSEGNLREDYPVMAMSSGSGTPLTMMLTYNSYNADGSKAQVDTGLGFGWTHSYNIFLFQQRSHMFRYDADGRVTQYRLTAPGVYTADTGYFETLTPQNDGSFIVTNKYQSWWHFALVPNTPYLVQGPIFRLLQTGDRNQNTTTLIYDSNGLLALITNSFGRSLSLTYTNNNKLATITDPLGRVTRLQYDPQYRELVRVTDADGKVIRYSYNALYQLNRKIDRDGRMYLYTYRNQKPFSILDGLGQTLFSLTNASNWAIDRNTLAFSLRRVYVPGASAQTDGVGNTWVYSYDTNGYITSVTAPDGATTSYSYDGNSRLISAATNANGAVTRYQYDSMGNRTNVTDALGNVTAYSYEPVYNQLTNMVDPLGRVTSYQYDSRGNRTNTTDALGDVTTYQYDTRGNLVTNIDARGNVTTYQYDSSGNRTNRTDAAGNITTYRYDSVGNRTAVIDALGRTTSYTYDALDRLTATTNAANRVTRSQYDAQSRIIGSVDANTNLTSYGYDARGRLIQQTNGLGGVITYGYDGNNNRISYTDELGRITSYGYDAQNRLVSTTNAMAGVTTNVYDAVGNTTTNIDPNGHITTYGYDALNRLVRMTNSLGGITKYDYSMSGGPPCCSPTPGTSLVTREEDANEKVTFYKYDELDRLEQVIRKNGSTNDVINPSDAVTAYIYDPSGNRTNLTEPNGNVTRYTYDALNRPTMTVNAAGDTNRMSYDAVGNVVTNIAPNGKVARYDYDQLNRLVTTTDSQGPVATNSYDPVGNQLSQSDGLGHTTTYTYDGLNRRTTSVDALGRTTAYSYDPVGNVRTNIDRLGRIMTYDYDGLNRRTNTVDALTNRTAYVYDAVGNLLTITDARSNSTVYTYDALDRQTTESYPGSPPNTRTFVYDAVGNLIARTNQDGRFILYNYNDLYQLTNRAYSTDPSDNMTYDLSDRMLTADRGGWTNTFQYDGGDRLVAATQNSRSLVYIYNIPGRTRTVIYPSGKTIVEHTDARGRLASIDDSLSPPSLVQYGYDSADRVVSRTNRNSTLATYSYNANDWVTNLTHARGLSMIAAFGYNYDAEGNRLYEEKLDRPADSRAYQYDAINRLVSSEVGVLSGGSIPSPVSTNLWNLDGLGNWNALIHDGSIETRTHDPANEISIIDGTNLIYDANGNLQQDLAYHYLYDGENRLIQVERLQDSLVVGQYWYDALGRRIVKIATPTNTIVTTNFYFYDDTRVIEEQNGAGATQATYTYGNYVDEVLTMDRSGQTLYYHQNSLWTPQALTDGSGVAIERYTYDDYGEVFVLDGSYSSQPLNPWGTAHSPATNSWLFTGRQYDEETGLAHYRARGYHFANGRFLQRDPSTYADGYNLYQYVGSNPINREDPTGLQELSGKTLSFTKDRCGIYDWKITWRLDKPSAKGGFIVQHIKLEINTFTCGNPSERIDNLSKSKEFWEAWYVSEGRNTPLPFPDQLWNDKYFLGSRGCSQGDAKVEGTAIFYEGVNKLEGFKENSVKEAGRLRARKTDPELKGGGTPVTHNISVEWNCCPDSKDYRTKIIDRELTGDEKKEKKK